VVVPTPAARATSVSVACEDCFFILKGHWKEIYQ
jgi:hypothetical protein